MSALSLIFKVLLRVRPSMVYDRIKQQMMDTLPLVRTLGIRIDEIGNGTAQVSMPDDQKLHNHLGTPHAGALFTLAETASGAAMAGGFAELIPTLRPVAKESRIQYQKVAKGATRAVGRVPGDLAALKAGAKATLSLVPARAPDQKVILNLSLKGITKGYDSLPVPAQ